MKIIKIGEITEKKNLNSSNQKEDFVSCFYNFAIKNGHSIIISINLLLTIYLLIQNNRLKTFMINICSRESNYKERNYYVDKDMVGMQYPEIDFQNIQKEYINGKIISSYFDLLNQLEVKLIYLEKEINATKLISFYTARTLYLKKINVPYNDSNIVKFNDIINWLIIHKSTQLKGIVSDKYLVCRYAQLKLGKNLCSQRIEVYNNIEEIDFAKIIQRRNVVLKISNGNDDNIFITDNYTNQDIPKIKNDLIYHFNREYPLRIPSFFHLYSKKRIVLEKMFIPKTDLYEFKFNIINNEIKMIALIYFKIDKMVETLYDKNYNSIYSKNYYDLSLFNKNLLKEMKSYALKLSEEFPNFIRVDLYIFHNKIYLSELTFDSYSGKPAYTHIKHFTNGVKSWRRIDY